jgi:hypothetical protein
MERALFWVEYVIRHKGADFMKTSSRYLNFVEYDNLDVYLVLILIPITVILLGIIIVRKIFRNFSKIQEKVKIN